MPSSDVPIRNLLPSVLDRLIDPASLTGTAAGASLTSVIESVRRDVEAILNTRANGDPELSRFPELSKSAYTFGLPELVSRRAVSIPERESIGRLLASAIARHEPRLRGVRATLVPANHPTERQLRFRIEATLRVDPAPAIQFETVLDLGTGQTAVVDQTA